MVKEFSVVFVKVIAQDNSHFFKSFALLVLAIVAAISISIAPLASAAPGDVTYKSSVGTLGQKTPFRGFTQLREVVAKDSGDIYTYDSYWPRVTKSDSNGKNFVTIFDPRDETAAYNIEFGWGNVGINNILIGNNKLFVITNFGIAHFSESDQYEKITPYHHNDSNMVYSALDSVTGIIYTLNVYYDGTSFVGNIERYKLDGTFLDEKVLGDYNSDTALYSQVVNGKFVYYTPSRVKIYDPETQEISTVNVLDDNNSSTVGFRQSSPTEFTFTFRGLNDNFSEKTYNRIGEVVNQRNLSSDESPDTSYDAYSYDDSFNKYEIVSDNSGFSQILRKYNSQGSLQFEINKTVQLGVLSRPTALAIDSNENVFVVDSQQNRIQKFNAVGQAVVAFGNDVNFPSGIGGLAVDSTNNVYATDGTGNLVRVFNNEGTLLAEHPVAPSDLAENENNGIWSIAIDQQDNVYILTPYQVFKYDKSFKLLSHFSIGNGMENSSGIAVDRNGNIFVLDGYIGKVAKFSSTGDTLLTFGVQGSEDGQFNSPSGIAVDLPGNVYISDMWNNRIQKFGNDGEFILKFGSAQPGDMQIKQPYAMAVNSNYDVFVSDYEDNKVSRFEIEKNDSTKISVDGQQVVDNLAIDKQPTFNGATEPYAKVTVTVHSDPVSCTATADAFGNWSCQLPTELPAGEHRLMASVTLADNTNIDIGTYPVRVIGALGTPGTSIGEGIFAPNTGFVSKTLMSRNSMIILVVSVVILVLFALIARRVHNTNK